MSIHIYENGTVGAQDGTEVQFLHFDGGTLAEGTEKKVTKEFYIRTDGEVIENVEIYGVALDKNGIDLYNSIIFYVSNTTVNNGQSLIFDNSGESIIISNLNSNNTKIKIQATIRQSDGETDIRGKLFFNKLSNKTVKTNIENIEKDINVYTGNITVGTKDGVLFNTAKVIRSRIGDYRTSSYGARQNLMFGVRARSGYKATNVYIKISAKGSVGNAYIKYISKNNSAILRNNSTLNNNESVTYSLGDVFDENIILYFYAGINITTEIDISFSYDELVAVS